MKTKPQKHAERRKFVETFATPLECLVFQVEQLTVSMTRLSVLRPPRRESSAHDDLRY